MGLEIAYTCNWCNTRIVMPKVATPDNWFTQPVHDPAVGGDVSGYFCTDNCHTKYDESEPHAKVSATEHYVREFYSFMNKMRAK